MQEDEAGAQECARKLGAREGQEMGERDLQWEVGSNQSIARLPPSMQGRHMRSTRICTNAHSLQRRWGGSSCWGAGPTALTAPCQSPTARGTWQG